jgi:tetratricopeptide (TPR) repeat protein
MALLGKSLQKEKEFKPQHLQLCLLSCTIAYTTAIAFALALMPSMALAAHVSDDHVSTRGCVKYVSALEAALLRGDGARVQQTISDFFGSPRGPALKRCFLFRSGVAFHSQGQSSPCWTMFAAFFEAFPGHESAISAAHAHAAAYAKGGTCAAIEGHVDDAVSLLQLAVRLQPDDSQSWNNLANVYRTMGLTHKALDACVAPALAHPLLSLLLTHAQLPNQRKH